MNKLQSAIVVALVLSASPLFATQAKMTIGAGSAKFTTDAGGCQRSFSSSTTGAFDSIACQKSVTTSMNPLEDSYINGALPNNNFNTDAFLRIESTGPDRALVIFDSATIAAAVTGLGGTLRSATLRLFVEVNDNNWGTGSGINVHRVLNAWNEGTATWNCGIDIVPGNGSPDCAGGTAWTGGNFTPTATATYFMTNGIIGVYLDFDVTTDVAAWIAGSNNYGWLIKRAVESGFGSVEFTASEGTAGQLPTLTIVTGGPTGDAEFYLPAYFPVGSGNTWGYKVNWMLGTLTGVSETCAWTGGATAFTLGSSNALGGDDYVPFGATGSITAANVWQSTDGGTKAVLDRNISAPCSGTTCQGTPVLIHVQLSPSSSINADCRFQSIEITTD